MSTGKADCVCLRCGTVFEKCAQYKRTTHTNSCTPHVHRFAANPTLLGKGQPPSVSKWFMFDEGYAHKDIAL
jgi:hypothetical protein